MSSSINQSSKSSTRFKHAVLEWSFLPHLPHLPHLHHLFFLLLPTSSSSYAYSSPTLSVSLESPSFRQVAAVGGGIHEYANLDQYPLLAVARDSLMLAGEGPANSAKGASFDTPSGRRQVLHRTHPELVHNKMPISCALMSGPLCICGLGTLRTIGTRASHLMYVCTYAHTRTERRDEAHLSFLRVLASATAEQGGIAAPRS